MSIDYSIMGERLKKARLSKKLTQEDLAEEMDVSVAFLSRVERGKSPINLKRLTQLCTLLDISEGYILSGTANDSESYLSNEFKAILDSCSPSKQKLIYDIAKVIAYSDDDNNKRHNK